MVYLATTICVGPNTTGRILNHSNLKLNKVIEFCLSLRSSIEASVTDVSIAVTYSTLAPRNRVRKTNFSNFDLNFFIGSIVFGFRPLSSAACCCVVCLKNQRYPLIQTDQDQPVSVNPSTKKSHRRRSIHEWNAQVQVDISTFHHQLRHLPDYPANQDEGLLNRANHSGIKCSIERKRVNLPFSAVHAPRH